MDYIEFEDIYEGLIEYAFSDTFKGTFKDAEELFKEKKEQINELGMTEWFIFSYKVAELNGKTIAQKFEIDMPTAERSALSSSRRSIYKIQDKEYLKDIFTNDVFKIQSPIHGEKGLLNARLALLEDVAFIVGDLFEIDESFEESIKRTVYEAYNKYCSEATLLSMEDFIEKESLLIYNLSTVVAEAIDAFSEDDIAHVFEAVFAYRINLDELLDKINSLPYELYPDEDFENVYRIFSDNEVLAEFEIDSKTFNVLCLNEIRLDKLIGEMESADIILLKKHMLTLDELL